MAGTEKNESLDDEKRDTETRADEDREENDGGADETAMEVAGGATEQPVTDRSKTGTAGAGMIGASSLHQGIGQQQDLGGGQSQGLAGGQQVGGAQPIVDERRQGIPGQPNPGKNVKTGSNAGGQKDQAGEKVVTPLQTPEQQIEENRREKREEKDEAREKRRKAG